MRSPTLHDAMLDEISTWRVTKKRVKGKRGKSFTDEEEGYDVVEISSN